MLRAVADAGFVEPTPIQELAIPLVLTGRDVLGQAQTGTGKTAAFTLPMVDILAGGRAKARMPRALVLEPTRELAQQVHDSFTLCARYRELSVALIIGGADMDAQGQALQRSPDVLIATPGRLIDMRDRGKVLLAGVKILVIDEADRMLDMGFIPDVEDIVSHLPRTRQTLMFSATIPAEIRRLSAAFLSNPKEVSIKPTAPAADTVEDALCVVNEAGKRDALRRLIRARGIDTALIFCNRKRDADVLGRSLKRHGFNAGVLHGDLSQPVREETLAAFRDGRIALLVASDVAQRGLDILELPNVVNFDVPHSAEDYVHRIGRTGRAGRQGRALTLATPRDARAVAAIERLLGRPIPRIEGSGAEPEERPSETKSKPAGPVREHRHEGPRRRRKRGRRNEPRPESRHEPRPEPRAESKHEPRHEPRAESKQEPRREPRPESRHEPRHEPRPERRGESRHEPRGEPRREPRAERREAARPPPSHERRPAQRVMREGPVVGLGEHTPAFLLRGPRAGGR